MGKYGDILEECDVNPAVSKFDSFKGKCLTVLSKRTGTGNLALGQIYFRILWSLL
jgi:hypothetical protein